MFVGSNHCSFRDKTESAIYDNKVIFRLICFYSVHIGSMMPFPWHNLTRFSFQEETLLFTVECNFYNNQRTQ